MARHNLRQFAAKGGVHRATEHHGRLAAQDATSDPSIASEPPRRGGRPKAFEGETVKVALFLPPDLAGNLKAFAAKHRQTPSLLVAEWIQKAELQEAIARGREAFEKGDIVSQEEAERRLSRY